MARGMKRVNTSAPYISPQHGVQAVSPKSECRGRGAVKGGRDRQEHPRQGRKRLCVRGHKVNLTMNFCCQARVEALRSGRRLHTPAGEDHQHLGHLCSALSGGQRGMKQTHNYFIERRHIVEILILTHDALFTLISWLSCVSLRLRWTAI